MLLKKSDNKAAVFTGIETHDVSSTRATRSQWIVGPWFDLFFLLNILWPLAFLPGFISPEGTPYVNFWIAYFLATPHRWMTILLVTCDRDRRDGRTRLFAIIALVATALVAGTFFVSGSFQILALGYAIIVGWHFASQHAGILRIYSRKAGGGWRWMETWPPRIFVLYASLRMLPGFDQALQYVVPGGIGLTGFELMGIERVGLNLATLDWVMLVVPAIMIAVELLNRPWTRLPKLLYLASFTSLYGSLIMAAHYQNQTLCFSLLAAVAIVHSVEYLAVSSFYASRRRNIGSSGLFQWMANNWVIIFPWYVLLCGLIYSFADNATKSIIMAWFGINLTASILHCIYDGMIWKLRNPATAKVLDVEIRATEAAS
ncbi:MAG: hypothetical protein JXM70_28035 [Pirellulales bacterium]|nr:hypothetical protein [Pirellulales bacterium]